MSFNPNIGSAWKASTGYTAIGGRWRESTAYVAVGGQWETVQEPTNLYANSALSGASPSGPSYGFANEPPWNHYYTNLSADCVPQDIGNGRFELNMNPLNVNGRMFLTQDLRTHYPFMTAGETYRISYEVTADRFYSAGLGTTNVQNVTTLESNRTFTNGTKLVYYVFTITDPTWQMYFRCGTTANNLVNCIVRNPTMTRVFV